MALEGRGLVLVVIDGNDYAIHVLLFAATNCSAWFTCSCRIKCLGAVQTMRASGLSGCKILR
jgi:hypothetical protein